MQKYGAILLAAGHGTRYKGKKQDLIFHGKPIWKYVLDKIYEVVEPKNVVVVGKDIPGGDTRTGSVIIGLKALPNDIDRVIIIEAARPMVTVNQIKELLEDSCDSTTFIRPLVNTVMFRNGMYINRDELCELLTPQAFNYKLLKKAYESNKFDNMTDETRTMFEFYGIEPHLIETTNNLYKITYPGDLEIIESIYRREQEVDI